MRKGQELRRTEQPTRTQRRHQEDSKARSRIIWYVLGWVIVLLLMTYFGLWNPMAVLAVLGGVEAVAQTWKKVGKWLGL